MKNQNQTTHNLGQKAVAWWCPTRETETLVEVVSSLLSKAKVAFDKKDFGRYHYLLNSVAVGELGYDTVTEEEELLGFLDDLVRGYC